MKGGFQLIIRQGSINEMLSLWYKRNTSEFFKNKISNGDVEFWTIEFKNELIGELYLFKSLDDKQFADGGTTAYLCAFRISENFQGRGYGTMLMNRVFERLEELGFKYVTIGVEKEETANMRLYNRLGFLEELRIFKYDPCDVNEDYSPAVCTEYILLKKTLS